MPSKSKAQNAIMCMASKRKNGMRGISQKVGKEFCRADKGKTFKK